MLPLEEIFFIPSLVAAPLALIGLLQYKRRSNNYSRVWGIALLACVGLCVLFSVQVWNTPFYSQRDYSPDNPGGPSSDVLSVLGVLVFETCVVIPAFPLLLVLPWIAPDNWQARIRLVLGIGSLLFVGILVMLIVRRNAAFVVDYQRSMQQERQQPDQYQHVRRP